MQFTKHDDGTVTVDEWDDAFTASLELLQSADPEFLDVDWLTGLVIILNVRYAIQSIDRMHGTAELYRVDAMTSQTRW